MFLNKVREVVGRLKTSPRLKQVFLYSLILAVPLLIYPVSINGQVIDMRKIREIGLYTFAIISCSFLLKNVWMRAFIIWCVVNWWINLFFPPNSLTGLTDIFAAMVLYISVLELLRRKLLKIDTILKIIAVSIIFQFCWMIMQIFNYDPIFYNVAATGVPLNGAKKGIVGWSGNPACLALFIGCYSYLLLQYFKFKNKPVLFFLIACISLVMLKNFTSAMCFFVAVMFYIYTKHKFNRKVFLLTVMLCAMVGFFIVNIKHPNFDRLYIWKKLFGEAVKNNMAVGSGINFFSNLYIVDKTHTPWREAHNDYLQMFLELGYIGLGLFIAFVISKFIEFKKKYKTHKQIVMMTCLVAFLTGAISMFPMHLPQITFNALLILSCLDYSYEAKIL